MSLSQTKPFESLNGRTLTIYIALWDDTEPKLWCVLAPPDAEQ